MKVKNVLSLFNGMSCGRIALDRAGMQVDKYYSSEVDKYAMIVADANYPQDIPYKLGDVREITPIDRIDLLIGGSPCQNFSFAGNQKGLTTKDNVEILTLEHYLQLKSDGFEFVGQSYLFWEYVRILKDIQSKNPDVLFLLENVMMVQKWKDLISDTLGVQPIMINSSLVSAQNRKRLYWTNITGIEQPEDEYLYLKDILQTTGVGVIKNRGELQERDRKGMCLDASYYKGPDNHGQRTIILEQGIGDGTSSSKKRFIANTKSRDEKAGCLTATVFKGMASNGCTNVLEWIKDSLYYWRKLTPTECERLQTVPDNYTNYVSNTQAYKMLGNGWTVDVIAHIFKGIINDNN